MSCLSPVDGGTSGGIALPDSVTFIANVMVSTLAGGATTTPFNNPTGVTLESATSVIVADYDANKLFRIVTTGPSITSLTSQSMFIKPFGLAFDGANGILYAVTDADDKAKFDYTTSSTIWTINRNSGAASAFAKDLGYVRGIGVLSDGRLVAADRANHVIWLIDRTGNVSRLAGRPGCAGDFLGTGDDAEFVDPYGLAVLPGDDIVVADYGARVLRRVTTAGVVTAFAGDGGPAGTIDGPAATARFDRPQAVAADANGAVYVSDTDAHRIRRIASGTVTTVAGDGTAGYMDGNGNVAEFFGGEGLAVSADGSTLYVTDGPQGSDTPVPYHRVRMIAIGP